MGDWKAELDALMKETTTFARTANHAVSRERPLPIEVVDRFGPKPPDFNSTEREEIIKRVQSFKAHQQRLIRERQEYAASILLRMLSPDTKR